MQQNEKLNKIIYEILSDGESLKNQILSETNQWIESEVQKAEDEVLNETYHLIKQRSAQINARSGRAITSAAIEARRALFKRRHEIMERTFAEAEKQLRAFTQTQQYKELLFKSAEKISGMLRGGCAKLLIREEDKAFAMEIAMRLGNSITVEIDGNIRLGGIMVVLSDGNAMVDDTLDERLEKQKAWFVENSGLTIT